MAYAAPRPTGAGAGIVAALFAGPVFVASYALAAWVEAAGDTPLMIEPDGVGLAILFATLAVPFGLLVAIVPYVIAATILTAAARSNGIARLPAVWMLAGAAPIAPLAAIGEMDPATCFALSATAALCALIARRRVLRRMAER